jgi:hypothetical protein
VPLTTAIAWRRRAEHRLADAITTGELAATPLDHPLAITRAARDGLVAR